MPPIERFSPKTVNYYDELIPAVKKVVEPMGVLRVNSGEDEQTLEQYVIYAVGENEENATAVVLVGNDASESSRIKDLNKDIRAHRLIAPQPIIDGVKTELHNIRSNPQQR